MGETRVGPQAKREYVARMRERYDKARRRDRSRHCFVKPSVTGGMER